MSKIADTGYKRLANASYDDAEAFDAIEYLNAPRWRNVHLGLERIARLMELLGSPQERLRFVHVAGTNGKGSTCAYLSSILRECGLRTGMFTSPYILEFEERIQVDGKKISKHELNAITLDVRKAASLVKEEQGEHPTEFELMCAVALCFFANAGCDIVVLEVGLGGRFDATNIIEAELCLITPISMDHMGVLGDTLSQIAFEKAGIIKRGNVVISAPQEAIVRDVLKAKCDEVDAHIEFLEPSEIRRGQADLEAGLQSFSFEGTKYLTKLLGAYQPENASLAIMAARCLRCESSLINLDDSAFESCIYEGVKSATWPGRFEVIGHSPLFIIDGAHNPDGAKALRESLLALDLPPDMNVIFMMGVLADKDYPAMIDSIADLGSAFVLYKPDNDRALDAESLAECIRKATTSPTMVASTVSQAIDEACRLATPSGVVVAFGTLYSISDIIQPA